MPTTSKIADAFTTNVTGEVHTMAFGGVFVADIHWYAGTFTATLEMSLDGDNWLPFIGQDGTALTANISTSLKSARWELLGQPQQLFRVSITSASSASGRYAYGRTAAN